MKTEQLLQIDKDHIWHPYSPRQASQPMYPVERAEGCTLFLKDGTELIDGMSSWWSAIHGYNHAVLNQAVHDQINAMSHVMFGGLTHEPAAALTRQLMAITPKQLRNVFYCDSGSVSVEVAMKMAVQYWQAKGHTSKFRFCTIRKGYHGDTFAAMSVCDPQTGMHHLFSECLSPQFFVDEPSCRFGGPCHDKDIQQLEDTLQKHHTDIAAVILEPVVQGAGGMRFYSAEYLSKVRLLCDEYDVLLILDEIATGFGRTGKLFAMEHAEIAPDILCLGKALTGGYMSMAATLCTEAISTTIDAGEAGAFMHGPTFMANPLACAVSLASISLLLEYDWQMMIQNIEKLLTEGLAPCRDVESVADVRILGAIGVVEMKKPVDMKTVQDQLVNLGVWIRPFGKLIYVMPPFVISDRQCKSLCRAIVTVCESITP